MADLQFILLLQVILRTLSINTLFDSSFLQVQDSAWVHAFACSPSWSVVKEISTILEGHSATTTHCQDLFEHTSYY